MRFGAVKTNCLGPRTNGSPPSTQDKMNANNTAPLWKNVTSDSDKMSMRFTPSDGVTWAEMDAWFEKTYGGKESFDDNGELKKHWDWRGFGEVGTPGFQVVLIRKACPDERCHCHDESESEEEEEWSERCHYCGALMGGKVFHNEEEFDEHPDREPGYNLHGDWVCVKCRPEEEVEEDDEEQK